MPELPEAETIARALSLSVVGDVIRRVRCGGLQLRGKLDAKGISRGCAGASIERVDRRGKAVLLHVSTGYAVMIQLGMSGKCLVVPQAETRYPHEHVSFFLSSGRRLAYVDPRRFGMVECFREASPEAWPEFLRTLGPEPLGEEFTGSYLYDKTRGRSVAVKDLLLNQHVVAGIGNIYVAEALFLSRINPACPSGELSRKDCAALVRAIRRVLGKAILAGGTTIRDYRSVDGSQGTFTISLAVYGRDGQPCPVCGEGIQNLVMGGRATCYCPRCQK